MLNISEPGTYPIWIWVIYGIGVVAMMVWLWWMLDPQDDVVLIALALLIVPCLSVMWPFFVLCAVAFSPVLAVAYLISRFY